MALKRISKRANTGRYFSKVRIWKQGDRRINVSIYTLVRKGFRTTIWYIVSDLPASAERLAEYACRWWQECTFKDCKSNMFDWERGRVTKTERVLVLLMSFGVACWALWLFGRTHEHIPQCKETTTRPQPRRRNILKPGAITFVTRTKRQELTHLAKLPRSASSIIRDHFCLKRQRHERNTYTLPGCHAISSTRCHATDPTLCNHPTLRPGDPPNHHNYTVVGGARPGC